MRKYNLPIFIPHRGCPHDCAFCNQKKITGIDTEVTAEEVRKLIKTFLSTIDTEEKSIEVAFFGGSFTGLEAETQEEFLKAASEFYPDISGIRISTRPDYIDEGIVALLKKYGVTTVELGVQSSDNKVLKMNDRGHSFASVVRAAEIIKKSGIALGLQMMLGMYGSNPDKDRKTVDDIVGLKPSCVRIYPVITFKDTKIHRYYEQGRYMPYDIDTAAELAKEAVVKFRENNIDVIRLGLHSSEDLQDEKNMVAGPYHPAFGEIVESLIYRDRIEARITDAKTIEFYCSKSDVSKAIGHKKMNKEYFKGKYGAELKVFVKEV